MQQNVDPTQIKAFEVVTEKQAEMPAVSGQTIVEQLIFEAAKQAQADPGWPALTLDETQDLEDYVNGIIYAFFMKRKKLPQWWYLAERARFNTTRQQCLEIEQVQTISENIINDNSEIIELKE